MHHQTHCDSKDVSDVHPTFVDPVSFLGPENANVGNADSLAEGN